MFCSCQNCDIFPSEYIYFVPSDCEFVGQIGNGGVDHGFWGRPEEMTMDRFDDEDSDDDGDSDDYGQVYSQKKKTSSSSKYFRPAYSISCNNPGSDLAGEAKNDIAI